MPRRKPKENNLTKEKELQIKKSLDDILLSDEMLNGIESPNLPPIKPQRTMDMIKTKNEVEAEARNILSALSQFYWDPNLLEGKEYLIEKQKIDALMVSTMAFNVRTAQHAITKCLEEIDSGNPSKGMFEVLAQLQNQIIQMPKNFASYMSQMEKNYKNLRIEAEQKQNSNPTIMDESGNIVDLGSNDEKLKVRGNKSLMQGLQTLIKSNIIIKEAEILDDNLVNPKKKGDSEVQSQEEESENFELDEDMFNI